MTFLNEYVELGFKYPCETEPIRDLPTARLVVSAVNRSTQTRVSSKSEISASVLTSYGREITVDISRLLSPQKLRNRLINLIVHPSSISVNGLGQAEPNQDPDPLRPAARIGLRVRV